MGIATGQSEMTDNVLHGLQLCYFISNCFCLYSHAIVHLTHKSRQQLFTQSVNDSVHYAQIVWEVFTSVISGRGNGIRPVCVSRCVSMRVSVQLDATV